MVGKGGAGKSVIAGTLARLLARSGRAVLALDSDLLPGMAVSLGADAPGRPPLLDAVERDADGRWGLRRGIGPVRAVRSYSTSAPDGVQLLQSGKVTPEGMKPIMPAVRAFFAVVHRLSGAATFDEWALVGDLPAGPRQLAYDWAPYAHTYLLVVEPTWQSVLAARRVAGIASARGGEVAVVANKVRTAGDRRRIEERLGLGLVASVPADDAVVNAERRGAAVLDHAPDSAAVRALERLAACLAAGGSLSGVRSA